MAKMRMLDLDTNILIVSLSLLKHCAKKCKNNLSVIELSEKYRLLQKHYNFKWLKGRFKLFFWICLKKSQDFMQLMFLRFYFKFI